MDDLYKEIILDQYKHPRHKGVIEGDHVMRGKARHASCGDDLTVMVECIDGRVARIAWQGDGCAISQAAMSLLSEQLIGKTFEEMRAVTKEDILALLGMDTVAPGREQCTYLCLDAVSKLESI